MAALKNKFEISVIIPTLNEEECIARCIRSFHDHEAVREIIVCDGGSKDRTQQIASSFSKVRWVEVERGRASQMNHGAKCATSDILIFLHADTYIQSRALSSVNAALQGNIAGSFYLEFDKPGKLLAFYSKLSKINSSLFTYGDQGLFIRREKFMELDGFKNMPIMEDYDMVVRLHKLGKFIKLPHPAITSARRFMKHGVVRQQLLNIILVFLYQLGVKPEVLSRFYRY